MKWLSVSAFALAVLVRLTWRHSSYALAVREDATTHKGYSLNEVIFWALIVIGSALFVLALAKRSA